MVDPTDDKVRRIAKRVALARMALGSISCMNTPYTLAEKVDFEVTYMKARKELNDAVKEQDGWIKGETQ